MTCSVNHGKYETDRVILLTVWLRVFRWDFPGDRKSGSVVLLVGQCLKTFIAYAFIDCYRLRSSALPNSLVVLRLPRVAPWIA